MGFHGHFARACPILFVGGFSYWQNGCYQGTLLWQRISRKRDGHDMVFTSDSENTQSVLLKDIFHIAPWMLRICDIWRQTWWI